MSKPHTPRAQRLPLQKAMTLSLKNGASLSGISENVSSGGVFLKTPSVPLHVLPGDRGRVKMVLLGVAQEFDCTVANVKLNGVGLRVVWNHGLFDGDTASAPSPAAGEGRSKRVAFSRSMSFQRSDGLHCRGEMENLSTGGTFLRLSEPGPLFRVGDHGTIQLPLGGVLQRFPCRVAHVSPEGLGLEVSWGDGVFVD
ncbi:MAG: PilZ domain-containing protein [Magnetococcales bacterium]|nr:PilZ domain-containing protein [Magnetococcales bacterium]